MRSLVLVALAACVGEVPDASEATYEMRGGDTPMEVTRVQAGAVSTGGTLVRVHTINAKSTSMEWDFEGERIELYDDGREDDLRADDGIFTGVSTVELESIEDGRREWTDKAGRQKLLEAHTFDGLTWASTDDVDVDVLTNFDEIAEFPTSGVVTLTNLFPAAQSSSGAALPLPAITDPFKTQFVVDPLVVNDPGRTGVWEMVNGTCQQTGDPNGPWGFRGLMEEAHNNPGTSIDKLLTKWLVSMSAPRVLNGITVEPSPGVEFLMDGNPFVGSPIQPWPKLVDNPGFQNDLLDWKAAPLQLIAIVNRIDLGVSGYTKDSGAEVRFVFTFIDEETCEPTMGNIILEYHVPGKLCSLQNYAKRWWMLDNFTVGSAAYNAELEDLTTQTTAAGVNPDRFNGSNLKFLRTNEQILRDPSNPDVFPSHRGVFWELQQFEFLQDFGILENTLLPETPQAIWADRFFTAPPPGYTGGVVPNPGTAQLIDEYIDAHEPDILAFSHTSGLSWDGIPLITPAIQYGWNVPAGPWPGPFDPAGGVEDRAVFVGSQNVNNPLARQTYSLSSCNGCHHGETFEDGDGPGGIFQFENVHPGPSTPGGVVEQPFRHVWIDNLGDPAKVSRFLSGTHTSCNPGDEFVAPLGSLNQCSSSTCCPIGDPASGFDILQVHYNEFDRRGQILDTIVTQGCNAVQAAPGNEVVAAAH